MGERVVMFFPQGILGTSKNNEGGKERMSRVEQWR
jgi:hypothetical protein